MGELRVLIGTRHFDESVEFYRATLGMPVVMSWDGDQHQGRGVILAATDDARIELLEGMETPVGLTVSMRTDDVEAIAARLTGRLLEPPTDRPWGHRSCVAADPNGVRIVCFQVVHDDPAA